MVDDFAKRQLSYEEQKLLPSSQETIKGEITGRTVFASFKRVLYKSICDPQSEVYKVWYTNGIGEFHNKRLVTGSIMGSLAGIGLCNIVIIISAAALLLRFGLDIYCDRYKPSGVMEMRGKAK